MKLRARDIRLHLGRSEILHGVDLTACAGQLTAIIGPNGSGKTTLLRALTGEIVPTSGHVTLNGRDVSAMHPEELALTRAVLPQQSALSFPFTVAEIIRIGLTATHAGQGSESDGLIRAALIRVGLPEHAGRLYQELSGGEQQRVQLARTLVQIWHPVGRDSPRWLLLDEPVSSLDIAQQLTVMRLAADYARQGGGVVAIMHDLNLTAMFADHVLLMQEGRAVSEGPPAEVLTDHMLSGAYGCSLQVNHTPSNGVWLLPQGAAL
ncbi:heme ABC transporter ATP-binding protein [Paracoccus saliphilus]|uniref:Heme ABC transporter ATP-binding protein n=1 Tax=Paracoccus saliphilus TaxID=405559 RepID=A0AA45W5I1_9RHOB|nr:heme ABC transporter ATP-binding protein [Paracoccus saliphilus]WCR02330.1 heme ABC transporter ATP-binding protein [Paracoccus saliphilus]SIS93686.1 iron complex transport system ATP-binding protein [Paracoccus saliphilus]